MTILLALPLAGCFEILAPPVAEGLDLALQQTLPLSPSNSSTTPRLMGIANETVTEVRIFSDSGCSAEIGAGNASEFEGSSGIPVTVSSNSTTSFYGRALHHESTQGECLPLGRYTHDTVAPTVDTTVALTPSSPVIGGGSSEVNFTVPYENATEITLSDGDITVNTTSGDATCQARVTGTGSSREVELHSCTGNGSVEVVIAPGTARDEAGNLAGPIGPLGPLSVDTAGPTLSISAPSASTVDSGTPVTYTISYSGADAVTLASSDVTVTAGGTASCSKAVSGTGTSSRTVSLSSCIGNGSVTISISAGTASDTAGNLAGAAGPSTSFTVDNPTLTISPTSFTLAVNNSKTFAAAGGNTPYVFSFVVRNSGATLNTSTGLYTAGSTSGVTDTIRVTDAAGETASATITVNAALAISPTSVTLNANGSQTFSASGGASPYTWQVVAGGAGGSVSTSGAYTAPNAAGSDTVRVTDDVGNTADAAVTVNAPLACPTNFIKVPPNSTVGTTAEFCVAKFEMRNVSGVATSQPGGTPWGSLAYTDVVTACTAAGFRVMKNAEWQTVARNIESVASNWSGGAVGVGGLARGHSDASPYSVLSISNTADPYDSTGNNSGQAFGSGWEQRRTHTLTNGEVVWDFAGNVSEMMEVISASAFNPSIPNNMWHEFTDTTYFPTTDTGNRLLVGPANSALDSTRGVGTVLGSWDTSFVPLRGGVVDSGTAAGIYSANLAQSTTNTNPYFGFRCAADPQ